MPTFNADKSTVSPSDFYVKQFKALSDTIRLNILHHLFLEGKLCVCDLEERLTLPQSKLSYHLKILLDAELVHKENSATWSYYWINQETVNRLLSNEIIDSLTMTY